MWCTTGDLDSSVSNEMLRRTLTLTLTLTLTTGDLDSSVSNEMLRRAFGAFGALVIEDTFMKVRAFALSTRRDRARRAHAPGCPALPATRTRG